MLGNNTARGGQARYILETLLATAGIPHEFIDQQDVETGTSVRCAHLVVGQVDAPVMDRLARETAVVVLPEPNPELSTQPLALDPGQFRILREPTPGGYLVGIAADLVGPAFALLARAEEYAVAARDDHDRFQWAHTPLRPPELAARPLVSEYSHLLLSCLSEACAGARLPTIRKEFWPRGKAVAGCLSHDVDVVRRGKLPRGIAVRDVKGALSAVARGQLRLAGQQVATLARTASAAQDPYWSFDRISGLEKEHGYRSTYYFMAGHHHPEDGSYDLENPPVAQLLRSLGESGCEIGLHGSYASYTDPDLLRALRIRLEGQLGQGVTGHRNHFLRFRVPDSWRAQEAAGFSYDATLGFADREGFRGGHAVPFHPYDLAAERGMELLEIPLAVMDVSLLKYRRLRGEKAEEAALAVLEEARAVNGLATLLWHNDTFYDPNTRARVVCTKRPWAGCRPTTLT